MPAVWHAVRYRIHHKEVNDAHPFSCRQASHVSVCQGSGTLSHAQYKALLQSDADRAQLLKTNETLLKKIADLEKAQAAAKKVKGDLAAAQVQVTHLASTLRQRDRELKNADALKNTAVEEAIPETQKRRGRETQSRFRGAARRGTRTTSGHAATGRLRARDRAGATPQGALSALRRHSCKAANRRSPRRWSDAERRGV